MSRKPTSSPAVMMLPAAGPPYLERTDLPDTTEAIEAHVILAFAQRLGDDDHEIEVLPRPSGDWPDGAIVIDRRRVGLELVEVVDAQHRQMVQGQPWYLAEIRRAFARHRVNKALAGMELTFSDMYKGLPPARSPDARQLVDLLAAQMATKYQETFASTPIGAVQAAEFDMPPHQIRLVAQRVTNGLADYLCRWDGAYFVDHMCLKRAIEKKLGQHYVGRAGHDELWLVAWDSFGYLTYSAKQAARTSLDADPCGFDAVWTCALRPKHAAIEQLWPYEPADIIEDNLTEMITIPAASLL